MNKKGFSLVELVIVIGIISILSTVSYLGIRKLRENGWNDKTLSTLPALANVLEQYATDHNDRFPIPAVGEGQNLLCYNADATYSHDCDGAAFIQGFVDSALLGTRYMEPIPVDPWTGSRYAYGVTLDGKYFQIAGLWKNDDGTWTTRTADNLYQGFELPSLIRAYDGPNFVVQRGEFLPYNSTAKQLSATLQNYISATLNGTQVQGIAPLKIFEGQTIQVSGGPAELYFSDGSITTLDNGTTLTLSRMQIAQNDDKGITTTIRVFLHNGGRIWNKVARLASKSEFQVETTSAIAGVRGTEFGIDTTGADPLLSLRTGKVWFAELSQSTGPRPPQDPGFNNVLNNSDSFLASSDDDPGTLETFTSQRSGVPNRSGSIPFNDPSLQTFRERNYPFHLSNNVVPIITGIERVNNNSLTVKNLFVTMNVEDPGIIVPLPVSGIEILSNGSVTSGGLLTTDINNQPLDFSHPTADYTISLDPNISEKITVRFVYQQPGHPDVYSAESRNPITIHATTSLTERALRIPGTEPYRRIALIVPQKFRVRNTSRSFTTGIQLKHMQFSQFSNAGLQATLRVEPESIQNCELDPASSAPIFVQQGSNGRAIVPGRFIVNVLREGECKLQARVSGGGNLFDDKAGVKVEDPDTLLAGAGGGGSATATVDDIEFQSSAGSALSNNIDLIVLEPGSSPPSRSYNVLALNNGNSRAVAAGDAMTCTSSMDGGAGVRMTLAVADQIIIPSTSLNEPHRISITCQIGSERAEFQIFAYRRSATEVRDSNGNNVYLIYSLGGGVGNWDTAFGFCNNLTEGDVPAGTWSLPQRNFLRQPTEIPVWCDYDPANNACRNMPNGQLNIWAEENAGNMSQAYWVRGSDGRFFSTIKTTQYGYRCVRVVQ